MHYDTICLLLKTVFHYDMICPDSEQLPNLSVKRVKFYVFRMTHSARHRIWPLCCGGPLFIESLAERLRFDWLCLSCIFSTKTRIRGKCVGYGSKSIDEQLAAHAVAYLS